MVISGGIVTPPDRRPIEEQAVAQVPGAAAPEGGLTGAAARDALPIGGRPFPQPAPSE